MQMNTLQPSAGSRVNTALWRAACQRNLSMRYNEDKAQTSICKSSQTKYAALQHKRKKINFANPLLNKNGYRLAANQGFLVKWYFTPSKYGQRSRKLHSCQYHPLTLNILAEYPQHCQERFTQYQTNVIKIFINRQQSLFSKKELPTILRKHKGAFLQGLQNPAADIKRLRLSCLSETGGSHPLKQPLVYVTNSQLANLYKPIPDYYNKRKKKRHVAQWN